MAVLKTRRLPRPDPSADRRIDALVRTHGDSLQATARQHSLCLDDAHDAFQRGLEIYLRRHESIDSATEGAFMAVVVKREAWAVRRERLTEVGRVEVDFDLQVDDELAALEERLSRAERSARSAEALRQLKPDEAHALMLKAEGHSYAEIAERNAWSYTKTNRAITEGRAHFRKRYAQLEAGDDCDRFADGLAALARGEASASTLIELRPHLRHCAGCKATVRELRGGRRRAAAWLPLPFLVRVVERRGADRPLDWEANAAELGAAGARVVDPAEPIGRWAELKLALQHLAHRLAGSDVGTTVQLAGGSGGGRTGLGLAAVLGICVSSVGGGAYCVATLVLPEKPAIERRAEKPAARRASKPEREVVPPTIIAVATPEATAAPKRRRTSSTTRTVASRRKAERAHESSPPPAPAVQGAQEMTFEQIAPAGKPEPAAAPATGGGEFAP